MFLLLVLLVIGCLGITVTYGLSISGGGVNIQPASIQRSGSGSIGIEETLAAAEAGSLTTRTTDTVGDITMDDGSHTITTGDVVDVYWDGGVHYGATVGTVSGTTVPLSGGSGDVLPSASTTVTVAKQVEVTVSIDGDAAKILAMIIETNTKSLATAGHVQFVDSADAEIAEIDLVANTAKVWDLAGGSTNPFTGNPITKAKVSNGGSTANEGYTFKITGVQDASP